MSIPNSSPVSETRSHRRYGVNKIASYYHAGKQFLTLTLDLGLGGMKIKTHCYLPEDEHLNLKLVLGVNSIWLEGRIAYSGFLSNNEAVSGIQFMELSPHDHTELHKYLATLEE